MSISEKRREQRQKEEQRQRLAEKKRKAEDAPPPAAATKNVFSGPTESDFDEIDYDLYGEDVVMSDNKKQPPGSVNTATNTVQDMDCEDDDDALYGYQGTDKQQESASAPATTTTSSSSTKDVDHKNEDKDETMLYGDTTSTHSTNGSQVPELQEATGKIDEMNVSIKGNVEETKRVSFWCLVYTADGTLQVCIIRKSVVIIVELYCSDDVARFIVYLISSKASMSQSSIIYPVSLLIVHQPSQ